MAAPALSEAPPHGICCHLHKNGNNSFNKDQAFKPQEVIRNLSCKGCLPSVSPHVFTGFRRKNAWLDNSGYPLTAGMKLSRYKSGLFLSVELTLHL